MTGSLEDQQFTRWLRRPTVFIANAWYLMAASGQTIVGYIVAFLAQALALFGLGLDGNAIAHTASTAYEIGVLALPVIWYAVRHDGVSQSMRLNPPKADMMLWAALTAFIGLLAVNNIGTWWMLLIEALGGTLHPSSVPVPTTQNELLASILLVGVVPGVCEELFFRGGLMGAWERRGTMKAMVITSALFTMLHGSILGLPTQILMGFVLGYVLILSDSLYVPMVYHTVHNSSALILAYLSPDGTASAEIYADLAGYIGGPTGYISLAVQTVFTSALFAMMLFLMTRTQKRRGLKIEKITDGDRNPMTWQELIVLIAGLLTVGVMYFTDMMTICGVI